MKIEHKYIKSLKLIFSNEWLNMNLNWVNNIQLFYLFFKKKIRYIYKK